MKRIAALIAGSVFIVGFAGAWPFGSIFVGTWQQIGHMSTPVLKVACTSGKALEADYGVSTAEIRSYLEKNKDSCIPVDPTLKTITYSGSEPVFAKANVLMTLSEDGTCSMWGSNNCKWSEMAKKDGFQRIAVHHSKGSLVFEAKDDSMAYLQSPAAYRGNLGIFEKQ